ncbi:MAG TPA: PaaI family thioesterase [Acidimicrobiia bacterium]|nr:PaaI family thioesterase [Acidimicrobiia bacterium]
MDARQLEEFIDRAFPNRLTERHFDVDHVGGRRIRLTLKPQPWMERPGGSISGPTLMGLADTAAYLLVIAELGPVAAAVTSNLNIHFLRRPPADVAVTVEGELLKLGRRLALSEVRMFSGDEPEPVAYATVTYAVPSPKPESRATEP